jgi:hypothetical protein
MPLRGSLGVEEWRLRSTYSWFLDVVPELLERYLAITIGP